MVLGIVAMIVALGLCGIAIIMDRNGRKADSKRAKRGHLGSMTSREVGLARREGSNAG